MRPSRRTGVPRQLERKTWRVELSATEAWEKITGAPVTEGRAGLIPVFDQGEWRLFRNTHVISPYRHAHAGAARLDKVRQKGNSLLHNYRDAVVRLEKLGVR